MISHRANNITWYEKKKAKVSKQKERNYMAESEEIKPAITKAAIEAAKVRVKL